MTWKNALLKQANWIKSDFAPNSWQIEASMLEHHSGMKLCPSCEDPLPALQPKKDAEGETLLWKGTCECGAKLTVFND
jgi:hypothetical protein